jgi:hypothetical protein
LNTGSTNNERTILGVIFQTRRRALEGPSLKFSHESQRRYGTSNSDMSVEFMLYQHQRLLAMRNP